MMQKRNEAAGRGAVMTREEKFERFKIALDDLCWMHGVKLSTSGYDGLQVWLLRDGEEPVHANGFENRIPHETTESDKP